MSEKNLTGRFRSKLKNKEKENVTTPGDLVENYNKNRKEDMDDFEDRTQSMENTLVGKPTTGRRKVVKPVEDVREPEVNEIEDEIYSEEEEIEYFIEEVDELDSDSPVDDYIGEYDFDALAEEKRREEQRREEERREEERRRASYVKPSKKQKRRSPYETGIFEEKVYTGPKVDLNLTEDKYNTGDRVRTLKPILSANKKEIEVGTLDIRPLKIGAIKDGKGYISARINELEDKYKISVLPFSVTGTLPQVEELAEHKIILINNMKYSSGTRRIVNQSKMDCYIENIRRHIERGEVFDDTLLERVDIEGKVFDTLKFNEMELQMINTLFLEVTAVFYVDESGDMRINVGGCNV